MVEKRIRILLIDDDEEDYILTRDVIDEIEHMRTNLEWVDNFEDALDRMEQREHDVYLVDYRLGGHDGLELMREAVKRGCTAPIILLTGQGDREIDIEAMKSGASDYLVKGTIDAMIMDRSIRYSIERAQTMEALKESQERFKLAVQGANDGVWDWNRKLDTIYYSPRWAEMFGFEPQELGTEPAMWFDLIHPEDLEGFQANINRHLEESSATHFEDEFRMVDKAGSIMWVMCRGTVVRDPDGNVTRMAGTLSDLTERKSAEHALRESEEKFRQSQKMEAVGRLAGGVAHDFNNLLTAILGYSDMLLETCDLDEDTKENVGEIRKASERAAGLTRQLLAFSRKQMLQAKVINVNDVIVEFEKMIHRLIGDDIELVTDLSSDLWKVKADPGQVEQVLLNLVVNSCDAMPHGGQLIVETGNIVVEERYAHGHAEIEPGSYAVLSVQDTGEGMDEDTVNHIFEPFFTTKEQGKGTGLGLSTVYGIVAQSKGHVWVYSEQGKGTIFKIYLPQAEGEAAPTKKSETPKEVPTGDETILLVEDEDGVRTLVSRTLQRKGYKVLEASHGKEALWVNERHKGEIDLVLTDLVMPQMGGFELMKHLGPKRPEVKTIYMSGYTDRAANQIGLDNDRHHFMQKPFSITDLCLKVRSVLDAPLAVASPEEEIDLFGMETVIMPENTTTTAG